MTDEMYLENLDEFVNDENKVVTYKWLSRTLGVHVNTAKQMLYEFTEQQRNAKDNDHLSVTYLVAGMSEDGNGGKMQKVCVVAEEELEATKTKLKPVTTCHVYSVQKNKLKDTNSLYTADYDLLREHIFDSNKYSAICYATAKLRVKQEESYVPDPEPVIKSANITKTSPGKQINKAKGKDAIAGMFAKAEQKKTLKAAAASVKKEATDKKAEEKPKTSKGKESDKGSKPQAGVMSFFSKQAAKPKAEKVDTETTKSPEKAEKPETSKAAAPKKSPEKAKTKSPRGKKNKLQSDDEGDSKESKRRRVKQVVESSSDEEDEEGMDDEPIPPTPPPSPPREPSPAPESPAKKTPKKEDGKTSEHATVKVKKGKKLVDKVYINDEGFMVTEKVWEDDIVEVSDTEEQPAKKPEKAEKGTNKTPTKQAKQKKSPAGKKTAAVKGAKQMSLTSFFKKK